MARLHFLANLSKPIERVLALRENGKAAPSPPVDNALSGHVPSLRKDRLSYFLDSIGTYGNVVRFRFGWIIAHVVAHPDDVRHVLIDNQKNYDKNTRGFEKLRLVLGNGLLTSDGAFWLRQRRIAQPAFAREKVNAFAPVMNRCVEDAVTSWLSPPPPAPADPKARPRDSRPRDSRPRDSRPRDSRPGDSHPGDARRSAMDLGAEMMKLTLRIAGLALLSTDVSRDALQVGEALTLLLAEANERILSPFDFTESLPLPKNLRVKKALTELDEVVDRTIKARRKLDPSMRPRDLLTLFMEARDEETGETMSDAQLRDEVMTMFLAGHETTANALTWSLYLGSKHPAQLKIVREEVERVVGSGEVTPDHVAQLGATRRFVSEVLRLYPPAWMMGRRAISDDVIGGYRIPKDSLVFVSPWVTHRTPAFFENPEGFDPDRFLPENMAKWARTAYFPFGAGPRLCIGQGFAMMEAVILLAAIVRRVRLDLLPGQNVVPEPHITLRPSVPISVRVHAI
jgi:cytochrome P450